MNKVKRNFHEFIQPNNILCGVDEKNGQLVLGKLLAVLKRHFPELDEEFAAKEINSREALFPTMIAPGLAIPHARIHGLEQPLIAIACCPQGTDFGGAMPAKVMILLLTPINDPNLHIQVLAALAQEFADGDAVEKICALSTPVEVERFFTGNKVQIPDYLKAVDLMQKAPEVLQEADTLLTAIEKFAKSRTDELPVIDDTNELRGMLSLADLLKYSLPEHLIWLQDLSPIYQLQPFSDMLKTADETKVADIMREEFLKVDEDAPAVVLAKMFLMDQVSQLVIVDKAGKLAGIVTLQNFSAKLFWE